MHGQLQAVRWGTARFAFIVYIVFSMVTLVGGFLTAPLMTWYFFGDWRFWRHWRASLGLFPHALRLTGMMLRHGRAFMFSVPLASPPRSVPDSSITVSRGDWTHGKSCGDCTNCCKPGGHACPLLDPSEGLCRGYDSFYWRYFNCGRFPSFTEEIRYYDCRKWALTTAGEAEVTPLGEFPVLAPACGIAGQQVSCSGVNCSSRCLSGAELLTENS
ncbi:MAG: hypothetical protein LJE91_08190 [Gammaproteobacteria bacterium]|jgi:hypothetical protein|nr:hypothetical protein [Gammaproteobacteria bacterium]